MMTVLRHLLSILILPFTVSVVVPSLLIGRNPMRPSVSALLVGSCLLLLGLVLVFSTIRHFAIRGRGTLAPWDPPQRLVVTGIYRYVRNPMITGVLLILISEGVLFASTRVAAWAVLFFTINAIYIPLAEEKDLARRFGADYARYKQNVPRWIPRLTAWNPSASSSRA